MCKPYPDRCSSEDGGRCQCPELHAVVEALMDDADTNLPQGIALAIAEFCNVCEESGHDVDVFKWLPTGTRMTLITASDSDGFNREPGVWMRCPFKEHDIWEMWRRCDGFFLRDGNTGGDSCIGDEEQVCGIQLRLQGIAEPVLVPMSCKSQDDLPAPLAHAPKGSLAGDYIFDQWGCGCHMVEILQ